MSDKSESEKRPLSEAEIEQRRAAGRKGGQAPKTMTEAALAQRRAAAELSTGPKTEEGKAASSRNNWRHGMYSQITRAPEWMRLVLSSGAKPCRSTCEKYPCSLVEDELTRPGQSCIDKQVFVEAFDSILSTLHSGDIQYVHGLLASQVAGALEVLQQLRDEVAENGVVVIDPAVTKEGELVRGFDGKVMGKPIGNPAVPQYIKLLDVLGINLPELMATPKAIEQRKTGEEVGDAVAELFSGLAGMFPAARRGRTYEGEAE